MSLGEPMGLPLLGYAPVSRLYAILFTLHLAACGGGTSERSEKPEWDLSDDIETPWSDRRPPVRRRASELPPAGQAGAAASNSAAPARQSKPDSPIDFDVKKTDLHDAFRLLADTADINIVVADTVAGRITLRVQQVSWREILQTIAKMKHLTLRESDGIFFVH